MTITGLGKFRRQEIQFRAKKKEHAGVVKIDDITEREMLWRSKKHVFHNGAKDILVSHFEIQILKR